MRRTPPAFALLLALPALAGCGLLFGAADLSPLELAGRYRFTEASLSPVSGAVRGVRLLGGAVSEDLTLLLREDGTAALQRLRGDRVDETLSDGTYAISGRSVTVAFDDAGAAADLYLPAEVRFEVDGQTLRADVFREGVDLEAISDEYRGITRADATLRLRLREIG